MFGHVCFVFVVVAIIINDFTLLFFFYFMCKIRFSKACYYYVILLLCSFNYRLHPGWFSFVYNNFYSYNFSIYLARNYYNYGE